jgi:two-component system, NtrC family, sensor kinase
VAPVCGGRSAQRQQVALDAFPAQIGRRADCAVHLPDDTTISRQHAEFYRQDGRLYVRDLGSTHGTSVNGQLVRETAVQVGDKVQVGQSVLVVA